ncbi:MAG: Uma2 family endonuclease [Thermosynechococcaceae cyanobacterium]
MIAQSDVKTYSAEEYLELEVNSQERHEYIQGEIVLMTGGTPAHNELAINLAAFLKFSLRGQAYRTFATDQRLSIPERDLYTYPDVMVTPKVLQLQKGRRDTICNPVMIAEVLSNSTQGYDRGEKFAAYRTLPTLQEYVLIDQYRLHVEQYVKTDTNQWLFSEYDQGEAEVSLASLPFSMTLADLYEDILLEVDGE